MLASKGETTGMAHVDWSLEGSAAVLTFGNPPVNSLSHDVRAALVAAIDRALADPAVRVIVLTGANRTFSAGADIREFGTARMTSSPNLHQLIEAVESSPKPVIAAIDGVCLGGGLELALGCHYRVASPEARVGLPEIKLGLLPGAGGTQRLPRLVGVETAINVILSGEPVAATAFAGTPLLDALATGDLRAAALELARKVAAGNAPPRRVRDLTLVEPDLAALCDFARNAAQARFPQYPAPVACIDAIEAAGGGFEEGARVEQKLFLQLLESPQSRALRHAFFAERAAGRVPGVTDATAVREIARAAVIGGGTMGSGIAICFLNAGIAVLLLEADEAALARGVERIAGVYDGQVRKGKMQAAEREQRMALLQPTISYDALGAVDIAIEAVFEDMEVKKRVFCELDRVLRPGAILASNTSTLDVNRIAAGTRRPQDVVGTHFFSPANLMRLLEIVRGDATAPDVLATVLRLARTLRKVAVVAGVCDGFIGNRMIEQYLRQALFMLEEGAAPQQVDAAAETFGFAMGPFRMSDLAGNDIGWHIRKRRAAERPAMKYSKLADKLCEMQRFGQKTGAGWYDYAPGDRNARPSPVVAGLIAAHVRELGHVPRQLEAAEITDRLVYALVNEGARLLEEGIALRASDIDVVYLNGYGFPVWRGGPMCYADQAGLYQVARRMRQFAGLPGDPEFWTPAPLLQRLAERGESFAAADRAADARADGRRA